jgi:hypothetical protein
LVEALRVAEQTELDGQLRQCAGAVCHVQCWRKAVSEREYGRDTTISAFLKSCYKYICLCYSNRTMF